MGAEIARVRAISGIEFNENLVILSRTLKSDGKGECRINSNPVTAEVLGAVAGILLNIHGQHETETLLKPKNHLIILDSFGGQKIKSAKQDYLDEFSSLQELTRSLQTFGGSEQERKRLIDMYEYQIGEIEGANLKNNEDVTLAEKRTKMVNFEKIFTIANGALESYHGDSGLDLNLSTFVSVLGNISHLDSRIEKFHETARSIKIDVDDLISDLQTYVDGMDYDEAEFKRVDARLDDIKILKRKYGGSTAEIFAFLAETQAQLDFLRRSESEMDALRAKIDAQEKLVKQEATRLSNLRKDLASNLESKIVEQLKDLSMPNCRFECKFKSIDFGLNGADDVEFLFSANAGQDLRPLSSIISGGEMSRFMLAIKTVTASLEGVETLVFDEIDTGISGIIAHKIAEKMAAICKFHQVIAVTHLAQIAARSDVHFSISKVEKDNKTITSVVKLNKTQSQEELVRMSGGKEFLSELK